LFRCIFCLTDKPAEDEHREHVFPEAIGGTLVINRVCVCCNSTLGSVADAPLTNHLHILLRRSQLNLSGTSGKVPDGVAALLGKKRVLAYDPSQEVLLVKNPETGDLEQRLKRTQLPDGTVRVDDRDRDALKKTIKRRYKRRKMEAPSDVELDRLIDQHSIINPMTPAESAMIVHQAVNISHSQRCIFKIAYELSIRWLGEVYIDDPAAKILREVALGKQRPKDANIKYKILWGSDLNVLAFWNNEKDCHVACSQKSAGHVVIILKIFDVFSAWIVVSETPNLYANEDRFIHIDPVPGALRESTFSDEIHRMVSEAVAERASQIKLL
jgi:HNH endonuclease